MPRMKDTLKNQNLADIYNLTFREGDHFRYIKFMDKN